MHDVIPLSLPFWSAGERGSNSCDVLPSSHIVAGLAAALRAGAFTADAVALEARKAAEADDLAVSARGPVPLPEPSRRQGAAVTFLSD
ncbi:hypothetical protein ACIA8I_38790 [Streptomyces rishiriensis]|uniref:hypothetical protein n=1 Tax=Streptomyces rishiriensis TaxID=68264 RepID=UPI0037875F3C